MEKAKLEQLIKESVENFKTSTYDEDSLFQQGTVLETLSSEGKDHLKKSITDMINNKISSAKEISRNLLLEREAITMVRRYAVIDQETTTSFDERSNDIQTKYQEAFKEVEKLEKLLGYFD